MDIHSETMTDDPGIAQSDPPKQRWRDRFILRFVKFVVFFLYEKVEVYRPPEWENLDESERILAVSNHFGGFADPLLLMYGSPVVPRIIARDKIWKVPVAGWIMRWIGAIPVHKPKEHKGKVSNDDMFASCYQALADHQVLLIFPEGITREDPSIAPVKTGAARIALGARAKGSDKIHILPMGIHYEDKAALRSRVFINAGQTIDLDANIDRYAPDGDATADNREAVSRLTTDIETVLRRVAPNFADWEEARALTEAAEVTLRAEADDPLDEVSIADRDRLASDLSRANEDQKKQVLEEAAEWDTTMSAVGLTDRQVYEKVGAGKFLGFLFTSALVLLIAVPLALLGLAVNIWPMLAVWLIGFAPVEPAVKATAKPGGAIVFFGIAWGFAIWQGFEQGIVTGILVMVILPVSLAALIYAAERIVRIFRALSQWTKLRRSDRLADNIAEARSDLVASVREAVPEGN